MTTKKTFWDDPYQTELLTTITAVNKNFVTLQETIAYAFSGGQQSDDRTINGIKIFRPPGVLPHNKYNIKSTDTLTGGEA